MVTSGTGRASQLRICLVGGALAWSSGCVRDPLPAHCRKLTAGELVVSEIRGPQKGSYRQWIELHNLGDAAVPVTGIRITMNRRDGTGALALNVRDDELDVPPGGYFVVGGGDPGEYDYIDFDYTPEHHSAEHPDEPSDLYGAAVLELTVCNSVVDEIEYELPALGTLVRDGDDAWCLDERVMEALFGVRGTPGEANPPCP